ncbi:MAG: hypothetical protein QXL67_03575, partial [Candidatus Bathyarchaeia archaeon]
SGRQATINLEKMLIIELKPKKVFCNPECPNCSSRMKSMGRGKGYRCEKCGFRAREATKQLVLKTRDVRQGLYIVPPRSQRHLTKPYSRYGRERDKLERTMIKVWHWP